MLCIFSRLHLPHWTCFPLEELTFNFTFPWILWKTIFSISYSCISIDWSYEVTFSFWIALLNWIQFWIECFHEKKRGSSILALHSTVSHWIESSTRKKNHDSSDIWVDTYDSNAEIKLGKWFINNLTPDIHLCINSEAFPCQIRTPEHSTSSAYHHLQYLIVRYDCGWWRYETFPNV